LAIFSIAEATFCDIHYSFLEMLPTDFH